MIHLIEVKKVIMLLLCVGDKGTEIYIAPLAADGDNPGMNPVLQY